MAKRSLYKIKSKYKQEAYDLLLEKAEVSAEKVRQLFMVKQTLTMIRWSRYFNFEEMDKYLEEVDDEIEDI